MPFHQNVGSLITLTNQRRTAMRRNPQQDFNNAIVFSADPLTDDACFEIKIDKKIEVWSGSVDIGVTACDPASINLPSCASCLIKDTWIMSGATILFNGRPILNGYGAELRPFREGDTIGVMRTSSGQLRIIINGEDMGLAASNIPSPVWAVVDLYGKCTEVTIVNPAAPVPSLRRASAAPVTLSMTSVLQTADTIFRDIAQRVRRQSSAEHALLAALEAVASTASSAASLPPGAAISAQAGASGGNGVTNSTSSAGAAPTPAVSAASGGGSGGTREATSLRQLAPLQFHEKSGTLVRLSTDRRTAERRRPADEFNNAVVMTNRPLQIGEFFELRIDRLIQKWTGSLEMGVTTHNPDNIDLPATMSNLRSGTIIMSGCGILTNGRGTRREYGEFHLDVLKVGDRVGMMLKSGGLLHFYINGHDQGMAALCPNGPYWGVVDLYGMTVKVTMLQPPPPTPRLALSPASAPEGRQLEETMLGAVGGRVVRRESGLSEDEDNYEETEKLVFHHRTGEAVKLDNSNRTAYRNNPEDDFNDGVVITNRPLRPGEIFTVQLERTVSKWAGTLEIGVSTANPAELTFPTTMTNMTTCDTYMMTSNGVMHNGVTILDHYGPQKRRQKKTRQRNRLTLRSIRRRMRRRAVLESDEENPSVASQLYLTDDEEEEEEAEEDLEDEDNDREQPEESAENEGAEDNEDEADEEDEPDRLEVWDLVGVQRRPNGDLHFYVNGEDLGRAARNVAPVVYGVVDLYGRAAQVSILSPSAASAALQHQRVRVPPPLIFHRSHGRNACVETNGVTAYRPHAVSEFNDAILVSTRPLLDDELFEVVVQRMVDRWSGSLEAGVTLIPPERLTFPSTMTDLEHDTWVLSGNSVMRDGKTIQSQYTFDLDRLVLGSRVGLLRRANGALHFFLDGRDMGRACVDVPEGVYALIDLYGQCAKVSLTARTGTQIAPDVTFIPETDAVHPALAAAAAMEESTHSAASYPGEPLEMTASAVSVELRTPQGTHPAPPGGPEMGPEARESSSSSGGDLPLSDQSLLNRWSRAWPRSQSVDTNPSEAASREPLTSSLTARLGSGAGAPGRLGLPPGPRTRLGCKFNMCYGDGVRLDEACTSAFRIRCVRPHRLQSALVFSADPIRTNELYELELSCVNANVAGDIEVPGLLGIGLVDWVVGRDSSPGLSHFAWQLERPHWLLVGGTVLASGRLLRANYAPRLELSGPQILRVGVHYSAEGALTFFLNGLCLGVAAENVPKNCFLVVDLGGGLNSAHLKTVLPMSLSRSSSAVHIPGRVDEIGATSLVPGEEAWASNEERPEVEAPSGAPLATPISLDDISLEAVDPAVANSTEEGNHEEAEEEEEEEEEGCSREPTPPFLLGANLRLRAHAHSFQISRSQGYRHGLVIGRRPLAKLQLFQVRVDRVSGSGDWRDSLSFGFIMSAQHPDDLFPASQPLPDTAYNLLAGKAALASPENLSSLSYCHVSGSAVLVDRIPYRSPLAHDLGQLTPGEWVGLLLDSEGTVRLNVNGCDLGPLLASDSITSSVALYPFVDVYGRCQEVDIMTIPSVALSLSRDRIAEKAGAELTVGGGEKHRVAPSALASATTAPPALDAALDVEGASLCPHRRLVDTACRQLFLPETAFRGVLRCFCLHCRPPTPQLDLNADLPKDPSTLPSGWQRLGLSRAGGPSPPWRGHLAYIARFAAVQLRLLLDGSDPTQLMCDPSAVPAGEMVEAAWSSFLAGGEVGERVRECGRAVQLVPDVSRACSETSADRGFEFYANHRPHRAVFAVEVRVRPGSYTSSTSGPTEAALWTSKEMGAILPTALLVKVAPQ